MKVSKRVLIAALVFSAILIVTNIADFGVTGFANELDKKLDMRLGRESSAKSKAHNFPGSAFEYAALIEPILGVPPKIDLGAGVEIPLYVDGVPGHGLLGDDCINPSRLGKGCISGSVVQRYEGRRADGTPLPEVVWVSFGRNASYEYDGKMHINGSVQMIGHNKETGATAFFESSDKIGPWATVDETHRLRGEMPWIDDPEEFNRAFKTPRTVQCVECHQNDPFIHNSFIDAALLPGTEETVIPKITERTRDMEFDLPYFVIRGETWDMRTIHIEGNKCMGCHRVGMGTAKLFMQYGWDPNKHMPPHDPGSLAEDWQELLDCWEATPEETPGCEWVIPPGGDDLGRVVGNDYPYKSAFNTVGHAAETGGAGKLSKKSGKNADGVGKSVFGDLTREERVKDLEDRGLSEDEIAGILSSMKIGKK